LAVVVLAVSGRLVFSHSPGPRLGAGAATLVLALGVGVWYTTGPGRHGWASRAGTPKSLLKIGGGTRTPTRSLAAAKVLTTFTGRLDGRMSSSGPDESGNAAVAIAMATRGGEPGIVRLTLWGSALGDNDGLAMSRSDVSFQDAMSGTTYTGSVVELDGNLVVADVESSGTTLRLVMRLQIDSADATVKGTIDASPVAGSAG
jgi:hypothetical protein